MAEDDLIFREIDEEVRAQRLRDWWSRFGSWIVALCAVLLLSTIGYELWKTRERDGNNRATSQLLFGQEAASRNLYDTAATRFGAVNEGNPNLIQLAKLEEAITLKQAGNDEAAHKLFSAVADDAKNTAIRNYAALHVGQWQRFGEATEPFSALGWEMQAMQLYREKKVDEAAALIERAMEDPELQPAQRMRLTQLQEIIARAGS